MKVFHYRNRNYDDRADYDDDDHLAQLFSILAMTLLFNNKSGIC